MDKVVEAEGADDAFITFNDAYVLLDVATLGFELVAVFVAQQLLYRMMDGSFGNELNIDGSPGYSPSPRAKSSTALGLILKLYPVEFTVVRSSFVAGIVCILLATGIKAAVLFDPQVRDGLILPVPLPSFRFLTMRYFS